MMYHNIYIKMLDTEISEDDTLHFTDGAEIGCYLHGPLKYLAYNTVIDMNEFLEEIDEHIMSFHEWSHG